jgi:hypothetical protein
MTPRALVTTLAALLVLGTAACSDAEPRRPEKLPTAAEFMAGTCRSAAEPVLELARLAARNDGAKSLSQPDRATLATRQRELLALILSADTTLASQLTALTTAIGFVRLRSDSQTYEPALLAGLNTARRTVQATCVR